MVQNLLVWNSSWTTLCVAAKWRLISYSLSSRCWRRQSVRPPNWGLPAKVDHGNANQPVWMRLDFSPGLKSPRQLSASRMEWFQSGLALKPIASESAVFNPMYGNGNGPKGSSVRKRPWCRINAMQLRRPPIQVKTLPYLFKATGRPPLHFAAETRWGLDPSSPARSWSNC